MSEPAAPPESPPPDRPPRLYHAGLSDLATGREAVLDPEEARHARKALRLRPGSIVELFDARGTTARAELLDAAQSACRVTGLTRHPPSATRVTLAVAIPKGNRADAMVDQLVQLGVDRLIPLRSDRSVVDPRDAKLERFERRVIEALKQCGRAYGMAIEPVRAFEGVLVEPAGERLILTPNGGGSRPTGPAAAVLALIGPEGGWTAAELARANDSGFQPWTINPYVLRIETAAAAAAALLRYDS